MFHVSFPGLGINDLPVNRVAFSIGSFNVYWYGILIAIGLLLAVLYAYFNAHHYDVDRNKLIDCVIVGIVTSIIGARAYYVLFKWDYFSAHPGEIIDIRDGGIAIYGAIIGALVGGLIMAKIRHLKFLPVLDITMTSFLIGQAIGRWGNFFNQEAFGTPTDNVFRMVSENTGGVGVHPCFLYESVWCALGFLFLFIFNRKFQKYHGQVFYLYLVWYGLERTIVEGLRTDSLYLPFQVFGYDIRVSQVLSAVLVIVGVILLIVNRKKNDGMKGRKFEKQYKKSKKRG
ncbi:MAG: prolipoprotein diacylglyceryl transferase [Ruminococcus sp.]|uniref:prolipoprotein diacylglyceryl transferase n=1 Tax=Ruminococcus sp. TaxID=41978 RepID=UPI0028739E62|nr:prolipoprotein diacylglyceryl transferase [Ruminococcus sp.]MBQ3285511.1 prolipoprotein diacylglyceryl transferase [Ruminococcus sp.]